MRQGVALAVLVLAGCGDDGGGTPVDAITVPPLIRITGTVTAQSTTAMPLADVAVMAFRQGNDAAPEVMTTSDANGNFSLDLPTNGQPVRGYLKATRATYLDTYLYPSRVITEELSNIPIYMLTPSTLDLLGNTLCGANQETTTGVIGVLVADENQGAIAGAVASSAPAATKVCYNENGFPNRMATATDTDGLAYLFNVTGDATVSASKAGLTFRSTPVNARAGTFTTTLVQP